MKTCTNKCKKDCGRRATGRNKLTRHHIRPRSRGGSDLTDNIAFIGEETHRRYHALFQEKTPDEIIRYLVQHCWNNQWDWVEDALEDHYAVERTR